MPIEKFCEFARECGADGIEVLDAFWYQPGQVRDFIPDISTFRLSLKESLQRLNLHAVAVTNDFAHKAPERIEIEVEKIKLGVDIAQEFGSPCVRVFSAHPGTEDADEARARAITHLSEINPGPTKLALENHGVVFGTSGEVLAISKGAGTGICFDIGNWLLAGIDPVQAAHELPFPDLIHVKDFTPSETGAYSTPDGQKLNGAFLGEGIVPIKEALVALFNKPDRKPVAIDLELECGDDGIEATREGVKWLRALLSEL